MDPIIITIASLVLMVSSVIDFRIQKIPNWLTYPAILFLLGYYFFFHGTEGLFFSLKGTFLGIGLFFIPYVLGGMGAGDAKLMGVVGAAIGAKGVLIATLYIALFGGVYALGLTAVKSDQFQGFFGQQWESLKNLFLTKRHVPDPVNEKRPKLCYGVAITLGTYLYLGLEISHIGQIF